MKKAKCCLFEWSKKCPPVLDGPKQRTGAKHIGTHKGTRIKNASVDMAFRSKVDYRIGPVHLEKMGNKFRVSNIALYKDVSRIIPEGKQIVRISRLGQLVQIDDGIPSGAPFQDITRANESGPTSNQKRLHAFNSAF